MGRRRRNSMLFLALIVLAASQECQGEYLMGGHLDNKETQARPTTKETQIDTDKLARTSILSSRTATSLDDLEHDFDLGLDLFGDESVDPSRSSSGSPTEDSLAEESDTAPRYRIPVVPYAFNGGQPFSLEKDPITGQIDFEKAPPLKALDYNNKSSEDKPNQDENETTSDAGTNVDSKPSQEENLAPNEINPYSPSFHDFLNLPVHYTYENSEKYPLISSSYANTKVQSGSNSYNTYNHKKYHEAVKGSIDVSSFYVQPLRKTYSQSVTKATTSNPTTIPPRTLTTSTTPKPTQKSTTLRPSTTTTTTPTTTTPEPSTTTNRPSRNPIVTTWKPHRPSLSNHYVDYEGTLPIEREMIPPKEKSTTTSTTPASESNEYEQGYEDYDHVVPPSDHPVSHSEHSNESDNDYYSGLDFLSGSDSWTSMKTKKPTTETTTLTPKTPKTPKTPTTPTTSTTPKPTSTSTTEATKTHKPKTTISTTTSIPTTTILSSENNDRTRSTTTSRPTITEEKRVTSMPLDNVGVDPYRQSNLYGSNVQIVKIDNAIPSNGHVYQQLRPPSNDGCYGRPSMGMAAPEIVVKSTSNVVVPPGQDTVSFVLGNRQSVGGASDGEYYAVHTEDRPRPMIVTGSYDQRPPGNGFDHALVSVGLPTVDVVNPGESEAATTGTIHSDSSSNKLDSLAQKWWASTSANAKNQQVAQQQQQQQQFGHRVVFPNEQKIVEVSDNSRPIEEHVIVVHETEIGAGNTLRLELPSQPSSTVNPTTGFYFETTTQRVGVSGDGEKILPELSENLTPPTERPNRIQLGPQAPNRPTSSYNYYHHQSHSPGNSRPIDYRDQRPQRVPLQPPTSSSNGFKRRPGGIVDQNLPNILPQFRPNAKTSHGHNRGETIGTIPAGPSLYQSTRIRRPPQLHHHHHQQQPHSIHRPSSRRPSSPPSHLQRLNPPPPPPPPPINSLRLPTPAALVSAGPIPTLPNQLDSQLQNSDIVRVVIQKRLHQTAPPPALAIDERHQGNSFSSQQSQKIKSRLDDDSLERFSAEPPQQPPRPPFFSKRTSTNESDFPEGMPRIATLQMIQQHGGQRDDNIIKPNLPPPYLFDHDNSETDSSQINKHKDESTNNKPEDSPQVDDATRADYSDSVNSPVYVVYPVKGALDIRGTGHGDDESDTDDGSVVLGTYGSQRPLPPDTLLKDTNDNDSSNEEPVVGEQSKQGYRPSPPFTDSSSPQLASDFPYPLERPDPSMFTSHMREKPLLIPSEQDQQEHHSRPDDHEKNINRNDQGNSNENDENNSNNHEIDRDASLNVIPYLQDHVPFTLKENAGAISATLHRLGGSSNVVTASSTPIAYVYTPTMRTLLRRPEEVYLHAGFERGPVLLPSQQASSSSSSAPSPQNFMAPFVASANAEAPTKNGWSVVMPNQSNGNDATSMDRRRDDAGSIQAEDNSKGDNVDEIKDKIEKNDEKREEEAVNGKIEMGKTTESVQVKTESGDKEGVTEKGEFDVENFTPQLFGGFKPIFEFPLDTETDGVIGDKVSGGAVAMVERPRSGYHTETMSV